VLPFLTVSTEEANIGGSPAALGNGTRCSEGPQRLSWFRHIWDAGWVGCVSYVSEPGHRLARGRLRAV